MGVGVDKYDGKGGGEVTVGWGWISMMGWVGGE